MFNEGATVMIRERLSCPIVLACDEAYAMPLATALRSLVEANPGQAELELHVLTSEFSASARQKVLNSLPVGSVSIRWLPVDLQVFREFSTPDYISKMTYARLMIPYMFPENVQRILYLDADILVLGQLGPLWAVDLEGTVVGAVVDVHSPTHVNRLGLCASLRQGDSGAEVPLAINYFNAGVLLIDLPRWRQERISENALEYLLKHPETSLSDQDALNVACCGKWKELDARWNYYNHPRLGYGETQTEQWPSIVHFIGRYKPWAAATLSDNAAFYNNFRNRTEFFLTRYEITCHTVQRGWARLKRVLRQLGVKSLVDSCFKDIKPAHRA